MGWLIFFTTIGIASLLTGNWKGMFFFIPMFIVVIVSILSSELDRTRRKKKKAVTQQSWDDFYKENPNIYRTDYTGRGRVVFSNDDDRSKRGDQRPKSKPKTKFEMKPISRKKKPDIVACLGAKVTLKDKESGMKMEYTLVTVDDFYEDLATIRPRSKEYTMVKVNENSSSSIYPIDFYDKLLSTTSPIGMAVLGRRVGEIVDIQIYNGTLVYEILDIKFDE